MHQNSLTEYLVFINSQIISQEKLLEHHHKAEALLEVLLASSFTEHSALILHSYFWALSDIIHQAKDLNEDLLNTFVQIAALLESPKKPTGGGNGASGTLH